MEFIARVKEALRTCIEEEVRRKSVETATSLSAMEVEMKGILHEVGNTLMSAWLEAQDEKYPADTQVCECGEQAPYVRRRAGVSLTLLGRVSYRRAYNVCLHCHRGQYP